MKMNFDNQPDDEAQAQENNLYTGRSVDDSSGLIEEIVAMDDLGWQDPSREHQRPDVVPRLFL